MSSCGMSESTTITLIKHKLRKLNEVFEASIKWTQKDLRLEEESLIGLEKIAIMGKLLVSKTKRRQSKDSEFRPFCVQLDEAYSRSRSSLSRSRAIKSRLSLSSAQQITTRNSLISIPGRADIRYNKSSLNSKHFTHAIKSRKQLSDKSRSSSREILEEDFVIDQDKFHQRIRNCASSQQSVQTNRPVSQISARRSYSGVFVAESQHRLARSQSNVKWKDLTDPNVEYSSYLPPSGNPSILIKPKVIAAPADHQALPAAFQKTLTKRLFSSNRPNTTCLPTTNSSSSQLVTKLVERLQTQKTTKLSETGQQTARPNRGSNPFKSNHTADLKGYLRSNSRHSNSDLLKIKYVPQKTIPIQILGRTLPMACESLNHEAELMSPTLIPKVRVDQNYQSSSQEHPSQNHLSPGEKRELATQADSSLQVTPSPVSTEVRHPNMLALSPVDTSSFSPDARPKPATVETSPTSLLPHPTAALARRPLEPAVATTSPDGQHQNKQDKPIEQRQEPQQPQEQQEQQQDEPSFVFLSGRSHKQSSPVKLSAVRRQLKKIY